MREGKEGHAGVVSRSALRPGPQADPPDLSPTHLLPCSYALAGPALGLDLLNDPDLVHQDASVAFMTALWFWMTPQDPKPSCHAVMTST